MRPAALPPRLPARGIRMLLGVVGLVLWAGCATTGLEEPGRERLATLLQAPSPAHFLEAQRGLDMAGLVEQLDDETAVRLGSLGPLRAGTHGLDRKRASFVLSTCQDYGLARAQVFSLFIVHSAFDDELREVLALLAADKHLEETWGRMPAVRLALHQRGLELEEHPDRPERLGDLARGVGRAATEVLESSEMGRGARFMQYSAHRAHLPTPYQDVLLEVEHAETVEAFSARSLVLGGVDSLTFGVPLGFYNLVAGTCHGVYALSQGHYEQGARELTAAAVLVAVYAGGKGLRWMAEAGEAPALGEARMGGLPIPELGLPGLAQVAQRLWERLGPTGLKEVARYIQARREAALLVYEGGEPAALALYEARGDVARAQAWLSEAKRPPPPALGGVGGGKSVAGLGSLVDEALGLSEEVVRAKLAQVERGAEGPRLSAEVAVLERQRPSLDAPPPGAQLQPLWGEYVAYWERRLEDLKRGQQVEPPLSWEGYGPMRGQFARGMAFERQMAARLRADAALPRAQRQWLGEFQQPRVEPNVGVVKPGVEGVRYADVLVIEEQPPAGQPPRVETFSFKSREFAASSDGALKAQMVADAKEALRYYGDALTIRRRTMTGFDKQVAVQRLRLIYEIKRISPNTVNGFNIALREAQKRVSGVEMSAQ